MKVSLEKNNASQNVAFKGFKPVKSDLGHNMLEFNYTFDDHNYDCYLELCALEDDGNGNYKNSRALKNFEKGNALSYKLQCGPNKISLPAEYNLNTDTPFGYHYRITEKGNPDHTLKYDVDAGDIIDFRNGNEYSHLIFNIITPGGTRGTKGGSGILAIPDAYNAMYAYDKDGKIVPNIKYLDAVKSTKHFSNKVGGSLAGIEHDLEAGKLDQYSKVFLTPFATDDSLTPHSYWGKNFFQIAQSLGNIDNYESLQKKLFARDKNLVSDAALCNEGLEGIHFQHILKWGKKSYAYNWFRADISQAPLGLGVLSENKSFITHKIINSPYIYTQQPSGRVTWKKAPIWNGKGEQGTKYDPKSPTYIQVIDRTLIQGKEGDCNSKLLKDYSKKDTGNPYEKVTHNDTVILYHHEINPETYLENVKRLNEFNASRPDGHHITMDSYEATKILTKFEYFNYEGKFEGNKEDWDANVDVAKLNYSFSNYNSKYMKEHIPLEKRNQYKEMIQRKNNEVKDYAISSAQYWTRKTNQILNLHVAQTLKGNDLRTPEDAMNAIHKGIKDGKLPASLEFELNNNILKHVLSGKYKLKGDKIEKNFDEIVIENMMDLPLDSIEFGDNIAAVFASPYLTKRATDESQIGVSRFELMKKDNPHLSPEYAKAYNKMNDLYQREMYSFALDIIGRLEEKLSKDQQIMSYANATRYGKFVLPIIAPEIAKFAIVKGLFPDAEVKIKPDGGISYDYEKLKNTSLQALSIYPTCPEDEALSLINRLRGKDLTHKGIPAISDEDRKVLVDSLYKMLKDTNLSSFRMAEMIVDRSQGGLDWRIDAAKDVADKDSLLNHNTSFETSWNQVIDFWKMFAKNVYKQNPNSYLVAEITDVGKLYDAGAGWASAKYYNQKDVLMKFLRETGVTAAANYEYFFTDVAGIFSKSYEKYEDRGVFQNDKIHELLKTGGSNFLHSGPLGSVIYSYNFVDNHDKPRALHMMALDSQLFYSPHLNTNTHNKDRDSVEYREKEKAYRVLNNKFFGNVEKQDVDNFNFMRKSTKAIAMGDALNNAFGRALEAMQKRGTINAEQSKHIYEAVAHAISDLANGNYLGKNFEADAFGTRPFDITIETVMRQAKAKHGLVIDRDKENDLKKTSFYMCLDPAISKLLGIMKFLVALPGIPTMYAGDDIASTGYEELTRNIYLQNRSVIHHEWLEDSPDGLDFVKSHKAEFDAIMGLRKRPELNALNDGAPVLLNLQGGKISQDGKDVEVKLPAILRHSSDGRMTVSLFNTVGVTHDFDKYNDPGKFPVEIGGINLDYSEGDKTGLKAGLPGGTEFVNANNPDEKFVVKQEGTHYYIAHYDNSPIILRDNTLNLYHVPQHVQDQIDRFNELKEAIKSPVNSNENTFRKIKQMAASNKPSFSGRSAQLYNPQYNFVTKPYVQQKKAEAGSKLSLMAY